LSTVTGSDKHCTHAHTHTHGKTSSFQPNKSVAHPRKVATDMALQFCRMYNDNNNITTAIRLVIVTRGFFVLAALYRARIISRNITVRPFVILYNMRVSHLQYKQRLPFGRRFRSIILPPLVRRA